MMPSFEIQPLTTSKILSKGTLLLIILAIFLQDVIASQDMCRNAVAPPSKPRGVNQIDRTSSTPIFELQLTPMEIPEGTDQLMAYKISVSIDSSMSSRFSEATIAVSTNESCGSGDFDFRLEDYMEIDQEHEEDQECPRLIQTKKKTHMTELLPLMWIPPSCGCVTLRMLLVEAGEIYYAENEGVTQGHLAKTLCFPLPEQKQISRDDRIESLCHVVDKHSSGEILSRSEFQRHRGLDARWMDHLGLEMALELRRSDVRTCCREVQHEDRMQCFDDARRRRIDQFCEDGIPDIPFRTFRRKHMRDLEKQCCFILGEFRYKCFETKSKMQARKDTTLFDYSMDASDIVNDLGDFGSHEYLDSYLKPVGFESEDVDDEVDKDDENYEDDDEEADKDEDFNKVKLDNEEDDLSGSVAKDVHSTPERKMYLQRAPPKRKASSIKPTPMSSATITTTGSTVIQSERELKRQSRRKSKVRNSQENQKLSSAARRHGRGGWRRKSGRRGSAERRQSAERRASVERRGRVDGRTSTERRASAERRVNVERRASTERRASAERRAKFERRDRLWKTPQTRYYFDDSNDIDSFYKPGFGGARRTIDVDRDQMVPTHYGFDDQETSHEDKTLTKLQKRMQRIKLLNMCCQEGSDIGGQVYGEIGSVTDECRHSSYKFLRTINLEGKTRKCANQFIECCLEEAKKGLTVTSQEFVENTMVDYWGSPHQYDPNVLERVLSQRRGRPGPSLDSRFAVPRRNLNERPRPSKKPIEKEYMYEQTFDTVKEVRHIPHSAKKGNFDAVSDRIESNKPLSKDPRRGLSGLKKHKIKTEKVIQKATVEDDIKETDGTQKVMQKIDRVPQKSPENYKKNVPKLVVKVELDDIQIVGKQKSSKLESDSNPSKFTPKTEKDDENTVDENVVGLETTMSKSKLSNSRLNHINEEAAVLDEFKTKLTQERINTEEGQSELDPREKDFLESNQQQKSNRQESRNTETSEQPRSQQQGRDYSSQRQRSRSNIRQDNSGSYKSRVVALDSREMAVRNTKKYMEALDSREMADQYIIGNRNNGNKNKRRGNWYRKNTRNYRYPLSHSKGRRRTRFG